MKSRDRKVEEVVMALRRGEISPTEGLERLGEHIVIPAQYREKVLTFLKGIQLGAEGNIIKTSEGVMACTTVGANT